MIFASLLLNSLIIVRRLLNNYTRHTSSSLVVDRLQRAQII